MSSLTASFLEDLDELNSDEDEYIDDEREESKPIISNESKSQGKKKNDEGEGSDENDNNNKNDDDDDDDDDDDMIIDDSLLMKLVVAKASNTIGNLRSSNRYKHILSDVSDIMNDPIRSKSVSNFDLEGVLDDDPEYKLVLSCNKLAQDIDDEIASTHKYIAQLYSKKFPELESLIQNKLDYIKLVNRIGNETDLTVIQMNDIIPPSLVMIVNVSGSTTQGLPLSETEINEVYKGCNEIMQLDSDKAVILGFVASRMTRIAPNICNLIGSRIAAQIVGLSGGVVALSKIPSCNIQVMGQEKRHLAGFSRTTAMPHIGVLYFCDLVQEAPPTLRRKILKIVSAKVALLARVDSYKSHPDGGEGQRFRKEIQDKIEKFTAPSKARTKKALPIPEEKKKSRRGGKRVRKLKERFAVTELRQQQNRISFSTDVGEYGDSAMGTDVGMVGMKDSGKVRVTQKKEFKFNPNKKLKKALNVSSGNTNGLSSLAFTPVQGLELVNPNAAAERVKEANNKWFNNYSGFLSAAPK